MRDACADCVTDLAERAALVAERALDSRQTVAVAESLTGGLLSSALAAGKDASEWFAGGVVAYSREVKFTLLNVPEGPVVREVTAGAMADAVRGLMRADLAVAVTGVGGPADDEGLPPGTVCFAVSTSTSTRTRRKHIDGADPQEICHRAVHEAVELILDDLSGERGTIDDSSPRRSARR